jgi:hypothetical protein
VVWQRTENFWRTQCEQGLQILAKHVDSIEYFICSTFLLQSNLRVGQKYMASWRFFLLKVSSADQIEHLAEILFGAK